MSTTDPARELQVARLIYPFYRALIEHFELEMFPCRDLEEEPAQDPEVLTRVRLWFNEAEKHIDVSHIRQMLQSHTVHESMVRVLILRHLAKPDKAESDRYKLDFLLGHYLAQNMPSDALTDGEVRVSQVAQVLAPMLGDHSWVSSLEALDECVRKLRECQHIQDLLDHKILEKGKHLKADAAGRYFHPVAMVAFTRFNFLTRRCLIKVLATDLDEISQVINELQLRGTQSFDCSAAGLGTSEPIASLRERIKQWRKPFQGKYSEVEWLEQISKLRTLLKNRFEQSAPPKATAAAASDSARISAAAQAKPATPAVNVAKAPADGARSGAAMAAAPAAKSAVSSQPSSKPAPPPARPQTKPAASWLQVQWKWLSELAEHWFALLRPKVLELRDQAQQMLSQARSSEPALPTPVATGQPGEGSGSSARPASPGGTMVQPSARVRDAIKGISEQVALLPEAAEASISVSGTKLSLSAREVNAFKRPHDNLSGILQRSAAVRLILTEALNKAPETDNVSLNATLKFAYTEATMLQDRVAQARNNKDVDGAMLLSAGLRTLQSLIEQAEGSVLRTSAPPA